jgi:hypothetical protein
MQKILGAIMRILSVTPIWHPEFMKTCRWRANFLNTMYLRFTYSYIHGHCWGCRGRLKNRKTITRNLRRKLSHYKKLSLLAFIEYRIWAINQNYLSSLCESLVTQTGSDICIHISRHWNTLTQTFQFLSVILPSLFRLQYVCRLTEVFVNTPKDRIFKEW